MHPALTPDQERKIWAFFESEWERFFIENYGTIDLSDKEVTILKSGFFGGIPTGAKSIHDAEKII
jgi:hypothetical protein